MRRPLLSLLPSLLLVLVLPLHAAEPPAVGQDYLDELARVEAASTPVSLEPLLRQAEAVQDQLMQISSGLGSEALIETYGETDFAALQQRLRGLHLQRGLEIFVQPKPDFLLALAGQQGRAADREFFRLYRAYWGERLFPVYMQPRALVVGCMRYGEGLLIELYEDWSRYARTYPQDYGPVVSQMVKDFEEVFALGTCACGDRASVVRELRSFVRRFPDNPAAAAATRRWRELKAGTETLPVSCG